MKNKILMLIAIFIGLSLSSCKKFLEFEPYGQPVELSNMTDGQAMQAIYALYY